MYFEYIYTIAAIVAVTKVGILGAVVVSVAKYLTSMKNHEETEKTERVLAEQECGCEYCNVAEHGHPE